jgi:hypothetical protein
VKVERDGKRRRREKKWNTGRGELFTISVFVEQAEGFFELRDLVTGELFSHSGGKGKEKELFCDQVWGWSRQQARRGEEKNGEMEQTKERKEWRWSRRSGLGRIGQEPELEVQKSPQTGRKIAHQNIDLSDE